MGSPRRAAAPRRLLFTTDLHGSTATFAKALDVTVRERLDALVIGGDLTGRRLCPIVDVRRGQFTLHVDGKPLALSGFAALADALARLEAEGDYPLRVTVEEYDALVSEPDALERELRRSAQARLEDWIALAEDRLAATGVACYVIGGNVDSAEDVRLLAAADGERVIGCEGATVEVLGQPMISLGWSTPTGRATAREIDEPGLAAMLDETIARSGVDPAEAIFNVHMPPSSEELLGVAHRRRGSRAVADAIAAVQPLLGLHGHVHEARGAARLGSTLCVAPGSRYRAGVLLGAVVTLQRGKVAECQLTQA